MFIYYCHTCGQQFITNPGVVQVLTPIGPQLQYLLPYCQNCMHRGWGPGQVQCLGEYHPAPTFVVNGQPAYDYAPRPSSQSFATNSNAPSNGASSNEKSFSGGQKSQSLTTLQPTQQPKPPTAQKAVARDWSKELSSELTQYILGFLDDRSLVMVALVCQKYKAFAIPLLLKFVPPMIACGSSLVTLKDVLKNELMNVKTIGLAVDKFPPSKGDSILNHLIEQGVDLQLMLGEQNESTLRLLRRGLDSFLSLQASARLHKMHNKFWILDREGVITGSPNVSFSGLEGGNLETFIIIRSARVAALFGDYLKLLQLQDPFGGRQHDDLKNALAKYNSEQHQLKLAMAPVMNITDFVLENLAGATKITIRQFLISPKNRDVPGKDVLTLLCGMAEAGVEIEVYLDKGQYDSQNFVKRACTALLNSGCKVYLQQPVTVINTNGEGLMHDKLILATLHNGTQRTLLGSAGFTIDVIANNNAENFICTDVASVYQSCLDHHQQSLMDAPPIELALRK